MPGEDRLEKMRAMAAAAQAEKDNKAKEEAERGGREQEAKGKERAEVEQALAGATAEVEQLGTQLAEAESLTGQMADVPADARAEFDAELAGLRQDAEAARARLDELNARKTVLDGEMGTASPASEAEVPVEGGAESLKRAKEILLDKKWDKFKMTTSEPLPDEDAKQLLEAYTVVISKDGNDSDIPEFIEMSLAQNPSTRDALIDARLTHAMPTLEDAKAKLIKSDPRWATDKPERLSAFALAHSQLDGNLTRRLSEVLHLGTTVEKANYKKLSSAGHEQWRMASNVSAREKIHMDWEADALREATPATRKIYDAVAKELTQALKQQKGDASVIMNFDEFGSFGRLIVETAAKLKRAGGDPSELLGEIKRLQEEFKQQKPEMYRSMKPGGYGKGTEADLERISNGEEPKLWKLD